VASRAQPAGWHRGQGERRLTLVESPLPVTGQVLRAKPYQDIVTADRGFDEAPGLRRVDPLDELAVDQLLNA
jgi:hypothetical protein